MMGTAYKQESVWQHSALNRYAVAALAVALMLGVRLALDPILGPHAPYLPFAIGIILASRYGGRGPGLAATALSALGIDYFFLGPSYSFGITDSHAAAGLALFVLVGVSISLLVGQLRQSLVASRSAEGALRESEEKLRAETNRLSAVITSINDEVWLTGVDRKFTLANPSALREFNLAGADEIDVENLASGLEVLRPDGSPRPVEEAPPLRALRGEVVRNLEEIVRTPGTGQMRYREVNSAPVRDASGNIIGSVSVVRDITERKQAERALRESEAQFRTLANAIPQLCWIANADGWIFWYNERWYTYTGTTPEQMEGWGWQSVHDPGELPKVLERWKGSIADAKPFDMVFPLRGADGVFRPFLTRIMPVCDQEGKLVRWFGTNTDISEQKQTEAALRESEQRFRNLFESMDEGFASCEMIYDEAGQPVDFRYLAVNPAFARLTGVPTEQAVGRRVREVIPEIEPFWIETYGRIVLTGKSERIENEVASLGKHFEVFAWRSDPGRFAVVFNDVTERKRAEEQLRHSQKLESIGMLAGGIAHDFNNLLVGVMGNASLAQDMLPPGSPASELVGEIVKTGEQAAHLTRQMLAYAGKGQFLVEPVNLSDLLPEITGLVQPSISKKIALHLDLHPDLPPVEADRGQMQQIFMNLVLNAAEAIGSDAGLISVKTGLQDVDDRYPGHHTAGEALRPGKYVCLEVRDTGCGMDEATKTRIFDPFFSTKFQGRGLGLAAVAGIVRGHKGAITVTSERGKGTCFTVLFPAAEGLAAVSPAADRDATLHGTGTILVVDDEEVVRALAKKVLERYGYKVVEADGGLAAIDVFKRYPGDISLVLLDASMPGMSGQETAPELRKIRPEVTLLVSSGYTESETMRDFPRRGNIGFIQKPYTSRQLAQKVKSILG